MENKVVPIGRTRSLVLSAVTAALYVALIYAFAPISFGVVQVRVADALVGIVPIIGMPGVIGITLGVFIGNISSPLGPLDLVSAVPTFIALLLLLKLRNLSVITGLISYSLILATWVGFELFYVLGLPFVATFIYLVIGIGVATAGLGYVLYRAMKVFRGNFGWWRA